MYFTFDEELKINKALKAISDNHKYDNVVFDFLDVYAVIKNGVLYEIPNESDYESFEEWLSLNFCVLAPSFEKKDFMLAVFDELGIDAQTMEKIADDLEFDEVFYPEISAEDDFYFDETDAEVFFRQKIKKEISEKIERGGTPFSSFEEFLRDLRLCHLESDEEGFDKVYFEDVDGYIPLYEYILKFGKSIQTYDDFEFEDWLDMLRNCDAFIAYV